MDSYRRKLAAEARDSREQSIRETWTMLILMAIILFAAAIGWCP